MNKPSNFYRYPKDGYIAGVCAGLAVYLGWNVKVIRLIAAASFIFGGGFPVLVIYGVLWYLMDEDEGAAPFAPDQRFGGMGRYAESSGSSYAPPRPTSTSDLRRRFASMEERLRSMEECVTSNDYELRRELRKLEG
jgi:phage shock protein C